MELDLGTHPPIAKIADLHRSDPSQIRTTIEWYLSNIKRKNGNLNAIVHSSQQALDKQIDAVEKRLLSKENLPLAGVPLVVKDNICTTDYPTTCASRILGTYVPPYDATVVQRLRQAGAVILGKANMDEFAMGSSNENSCFGPCKNPWDLRRVPGGSSGGSAAAVAADMAPVSLGSDTGGSVRQPAGFCGVYGYKPTYGYFSRYGLVAYGSSLDQIGILSHNPSDSLLISQCVHGFDSMDSTSLNLEPPASEVTLDWSGLRLGIVSQAFAAGLDDDVRSSCEQAIDKMVDAGATKIVLDLDFLDYLVAVYYVVATAEASSNLLRFDGIRYGFRAEGASDLQELYENTRHAFGDEVKRRILLGTFVLSSGYYDSYYGKAKRAQGYISNKFNSLFDKCDVVVMPTSPSTAFKIDAKVSDPLSMYLSDIYTILCNLTGTPGVSVPCGFSSEGLPIGLQLIGKHKMDQHLLGVAELYHQLGCHDFQRRPGE